MEKKITIELYRDVADEVLGAIMDADPSRHDVNLLGQAKHAVQEALQAVTPLFLNDQDAELLKRVLSVSQSNTSIYTPFEIDRIADLQKKIGS
jgi:hypothetical protein